MKILILNVGSSSIKCYLYSSTHLHDSTHSPLWEATLEWKNTFDDVSLKIQTEAGVTHSEKIKEKNTMRIFQKMLNSLVEGEAAVLPSLDEVDVIGHRIVHGGKFYQASVIVDQQVIKNIRLLADIAPLHNPPGLEGIEIMEKLIPYKPQIAVFDTSFHHTLPPLSYSLSCPLQLV